MNNQRNLMIVLLIMVLWFAMFFFFAKLGLAADIKTAWDASDGAAGYKIQMSTDIGATWSEPRDAGNNTTFTWMGAPDTGLLLFRAAAYNQSQEVIRYEAGAWYNGSWKPPASPTGLGLK